jgi:DNA/RNA endonuclease YhcR with UshA esterase domain
MKMRNNLLAGLLLIAISIGSCVKGDFDAPPIYIPTVNFEANKTIAELKATYSGIRMIEEDIIIKGIVIANDESGNLYKKLVIQDETGGIELTIDKTNTYNQYKVGQRIYVKTKGMYIGDYNGLIQLGYDNEGAIGWLPEVMIEDHIFADSLPGPKPEPRVISLSQFSPTLISTLVKIENVSFIDEGEVWAVQGVNATNRGINEIGVSQFVVRTSSFADFAYERIPSGKGSITGVLSVFRDTYQLTLRDIDDVNDFEGNGGGGGEPGELNPIDELDEKFAAAVENQDIDFTGWTNFAEAGSRRWQGKIFSGNGYAQATGFNSNLQSMITWLITPPVTMNEEKMLRFKTAKAFWAHADNTGLTIWASTNYDGVNIAAASWTQIDARIANQSDADNAWIESGDIDLTPFMTDEYVFIAFKYRGSGTESTSFRIDDVYIGTEENGGGGGGEGGGTFDEPFNVAQAIENQNATPYVVGWIEGYIVGSVKAGTSAVNSAGDIDFSAPFTSATNVLLADNENETNYMNCVIVNLPAGTTLRSDVNLLDNPDNHKKKLKVTGVLRTYFGVAGLRDSAGTNDDFELEGGNGGGGGDNIFSESFSSTLGSFTAHNINGPKNWEWASFDGGCAYINGYDGSANTTNEDWLVSPSIDLSEHANSLLSIRHAANYVNGQWDFLQVMISSDYDGTSNPTTQGTWVEISIPNLPPGNNWTFVESGDIDISEFDGQSSMYIALRYRSTTSVAPAWEVSVIEVK